MMRQTDMFWLFYNFIIFVCVRSKGIQVSKYSPGDVTSSEEVTGDVIDNISMTKCAIACATSEKCPHFIYDTNSSKCLTPGNKFKVILSGKSWKSLNKVYGRGELATSMSTSTTTTTTTSTVPSTSHLLPTTNTAVYEEECPNHGKYFEKFCYEPYYVAATFDGALRACKRKHAYAAEVLNKRTQTFLKDSLYGIEARCMWLGARRGMIKKTYVWQHSQKKVVYNDWIGGKPDGGNPSKLLIEHCMSATPQNIMKWNDMPCLSKCAYLCQRRWKKKLRVKYKMESCGDYNGIAFDGVCYSHFREHLTWSNAVKKCKKLKMHIVEIPTKKVNKFLIHLIGHLKVVNTEFIWSGLNDRKKEYSWVWEGSRKRTHFKFWSKGNPSGRRNKLQFFKPDEDCVEISIFGHFKWNDRPCKDKGTFICQFKQ